MSLEVPTLKDNINTNKCARLRTAVHSGARVFLLMQIPTTRASLCPYKLPYIQTVRVKTSRKGQVWILNLQDMHPHE